jgi:hypothetical protein
MENRINGLIEAYSYEEGDSYLKCLMIYVLNENHSLSYYLSK